MNLKPLGFKPPLFALDADVEWVLLRAFGPPDARPRKKTAPERALSLASALDLGARIASRQAHELLCEELGVEASTILRAHYLDNVARDALLGVSLNALLDHAERRSVPCILLKYAALSRLGVLRPGSRSAVDLDVLVPTRSAEQFQALLQGFGYRDLGLPASRHQLPGLSDPSDVLIELHRHVPAVTLPGDDIFVEADRLLQSELVIRRSNAWVPTPALLAAHTLAHSLVQHARAPHMCSPLKAIADLADLHRTGHRLEGATSFLGRAMPKQDVDDAIGLTNALLSADLEAAQRGGVGTLLRHALASRLDERYAASLRLRGLTRPGPTSIHFDPLKLADICGSVYLLIRRAFLRDKQRL